MLYPETPDACRSYAAAATQLMNDHGIAPHPENYTLCYTYCTGRHPNLVRALDRLIASGKAGDPQRLAALFAAFFGAGDRETRTVHEASARLQRTMEQVQRYLGEANDDAATSGRRLAGLSGEVAGAQAQGRLDSLIGDIVEVAEGLIESTRKLETRVEESAKEVSDLRENLEVVRQEAMTDSLTGLANRRHFDEALEAAVREADAGKTDLSLILFDIDYFKRFNDSYGHRIGDEVLKVLAKLLLGQIDMRETAARYGGEEFALLLPGTDRATAVAMAERIRGTLAGRRLKNKVNGQTLGTVTLSAGVALLRKGESAADLLQRADESLYAAKQSGRNRTASEGAGLDSLTTATAWL